MFFTTGGAQSRNGGHMVLDFAIDLDALHFELCNDLNQLTLFGPVRAA
jgi:hypothetical protein